MTVELREQRLGELRWIALRGPGTEAFGALGRHMRAEIRAAVSEWDYLPRLRQHVSGPPGSERLAAVSRTCATIPRRAASPTSSATGPGASSPSRRWPGGTPAGRSAREARWPGTNHVRYLAGAEADPHGNSVARGEVLQALDVPADEPDAAWFARVLAGAPLPEGVRADYSPGHPGMTLCTFVANLTSGEAALLGRDAEAVTIPLADLAHGRAGAQRPAGLPSLRSQAATTT